MKVFILSILDMRVNIDLEDYTASDTSSDDTISSLNSSPLDRYRINRNIHQYSPSSLSSFEYSSNSSEYSELTYYYMPEARAIYDRQPIIRANNVAPLISDIEEGNDNTSIESIDSSVSDNSNHLINNEIKCSKSTLLIIFTIFLFYLINSSINDSLKNGYDNFYELTFRTLSDYPNCKPVQHEIWRLFTNSLLHMDLSHLLANACFIYFIGYLLENIIGHINLLIYFFIGSVTGCLALAYINRFVISIGASCGLMSLSGALLGTLPLNYDSIDRCGLFLLGLSALLPLFIDIIGYSTNYNENISYIGHWTGYINGFLISVFNTKNIISKNWKLIVKTSFINIFIAFNFYLLFDYFHNTYKTNVMNENLKNIEINTCCYAYIKKYDFNHNFTCANN